MIMKENEILSIDELVELNINSKDTVKSLVKGENPTELMLKIYNIAVESIKHLYTVYTTAPGLIQFVAFEGKNGCGDFLYDDMQNVFECMKQIRRLRDVQTVWVQEMNRDTCDDVSYWNICIQY